MIRPIVCISHVARKFPARQVNQTTRGRCVRCISIGRRHARSKSTSTSPQKPDPNEIPPHAGPKAFAVGVLGGTLGSFVGIGGGVFTIPIITSSYFRLTQRQANASNLVAVAATGFAGAAAYALADESVNKENEDVSSQSNVQLDMAMAAAICGMVTARVGAKLSNKLSERTLKRGLAAVMYTAAPAVHLQSYIDGTGSKEATTKRENEQSLSRLLPAAIIGSSAGIFSGITGLGGGIITVSAFTLFTDLTYKQALGTSLCAMVLPASVGAITHHFSGNIVWRVAPFLAAGAGCGAYAGGTIGSNLPDTELKYCFSAAMLALGTRVLLRA